MMFRRYNLVCWSYQLLKLFLGKGGGKPFVLALSNDTVSFFIWSSYYNSATLAFLEIQSVPAQCPLFLNLVF